MVVKDLTVSGILGARSITRMGGMAEWDRTVRGQLALTSRLASLGSMLSICSLSMRVDSRIMVKSKSQFIKRRQQQQQQQQRNYGVFDIRVMPKQ